MTKDWKTPRHVTVRLTTDTMNVAGSVGGSNTAITYTPKIVVVKAMVSVRTLTWTVVLMQLVISCACFIASLAIISAKMNSESTYEDKQYVSFEWWLFCFLSFSMIINTVIAMYALSEHNRYLLVPHILFLILCNGLSCYMLYYTIANFDSTDFNWYIALVLMIFTDPRSMHIRFKSSGKLPLCSLLTCQMLAATFLLADSLPLVLFHDFGHLSVKITTMVLMYITVIWMITSICAIFCSFSNNISLLKIHLLINILISLIYVIKLVILTISGNLFTIFLTIFVNLLNVSTIYYEIKFIKFLVTLQTV